MWKATDTVDDRVAQMQVRGRHVDLGAQHVRAVLELARTHAFEEIKILLCGTRPVRTVLSRLPRSSSIFPDLVLAQAVHVGLAGIDQLDGVSMQLVEVVRGTAQVLAPIETEPAHVFLNGLLVLSAFPQGVGVVEAQVAEPAGVLAGDAEIEANGFCVTDVQITVGLRWKTRHHPRGSPRLQIIRDDLTDEIRRSTAFAGIPIVRHLSSSLRKCPGQPKHGDVADFRGTVPTSIHGALHGKKNRAAPGLSSAIHP